MASISKTAPIIIVRNALAPMEWRFRSDSLISRTDFTGMPTPRIPYFSAGAYSMLIMPWNPVISNVSVIVWFALRTRTSSPSTASMRCWSARRMRSPAEEM